MRLGGLKWESDLAAAHHKLVHIEHEIAREGELNTYIALWTEAERKDYPSFASRLKIHLPRLEARGLGYYDPFTNSPEIRE